MINRIVGFFWGIWCFIVLSTVVILTAITVWILTFLFGYKSKKVCLYIAQKISCQLICGLSLIRVKTHGREHFEKDKGYVIIANHNSNYDIFTNSIATPFNNVFCFLSKHTLGKMPFFGIIAKNLAVLVDRSSMKGKYKSFQKMKEILEMGISVMIFAEGTRNKTDNPLLNFKNGAFRLAIDMKKPIIVSTMVGIKKISDPNKFIYKLPGTTHCYFEEAISTENLTNTDIPKLKEQVRELMMSRLELKK